MPAVTRDKTALLVDSKGSPPPKSRTRCYILSAVIIVIAAITTLSLVFLVFTDDNDADAQSSAPSPTLGTPNRPNMLFIVMDDLGFTDTGQYSNYLSGNDYSFSTPVIERLSSQGIRLNYHYSEPICSTTRSAMLSGRYAWRTGLDFAYEVGSMFHTDSDMTLFPQILRDVFDYDTLIAGKWHLGYKEEAFLPFSRGFDETLFFTMGGLGYYDHTTCSPWSTWDDEWVYMNESEDLVSERNALWGNGRQCATDLWNEQYEPVHRAGTYDERLFTDKILNYIEASNQSNPFFIYYPMPTPHVPLTTPPVTGYAECEHIADTQRKVLCEMVLYGDNLIQEIVDSIESKGIMDNTVIVFLSDNGGSTGNGRGQNLPLRGRKGGRYEGGIRTASFITGGYVDRFLGNITERDGHCDYNRQFHVSDWFSTLIQIASSNETLLSDDIARIVAEYNDTTDLDAIGLWPDILAECGYIDDALINNTEMIESRTTTISARMCGENGDDDQYFISTYIRSEIEGEEWKMIVNHSGDCNNPLRGGTDPPINYWLDFNGRSMRTPDFQIYEEYMDPNNELVDSNLFRSHCLDAMDESDRNENNTMFWYNDIMLFRIDEDPIEACDVADNYTEIVDELLMMLEENVKGNYYGSYIDPPSAASALMQFTSWDCDTDAMYLKAWDSLEDEMVYNESSFDDWSYVWERAIEVRGACPSALVDSAPHDSIKSLFFVFAVVSVVVSVMF